MKEKAQGKLEEIRGKATGSKAEQLRGKSRQKLAGAKQAAKSAAYDAEHPPRRRSR